MSNPQTEDGYTMLADELIDALAGIRISGEAMQVFWSIVRKTYGFKKKADWIALSQFQKMTGMNKSSIIRAIKKLVLMNIVDKKVNVMGVSYSINKHYGSWKPLTKKSTIDKKVNHRLQKSKSALTKKSPTIETITKENTTRKKETIERFFEEFWILYPHHVAKSKCRTKFDNIPESEFPKIIEAVKNQLQTTWLGKEIKFIPHPMTWLNQERWNDDLVEPTKPVIKKNYIGSFGDGGGGSSSTPEEEIPF